MYPEDMPMSTALLVPYGHEVYYNVEDDHFLFKKDFMLIFVMGALVIFGILGITVGVISSN